jgi:hypothetical protein
MTQANALQQEVSYRGSVYCAASGQWAFCLFRDGEEIARGAGFQDEVEAGMACDDHLPGIDFPIHLVVDPDFDLSVESSVDFRIAQTNSIIYSHVSHFLLNPHDSLDADDVLVLLNRLHFVLNGHEPDGFSFDDGEVDE